MNIELGQYEVGRIAIFGLKSFAKAGVRGRRFVVEADIKEIFEGDHVLGHVDSPFEDLWSNVGEECVETEDGTKEVMTCLSLGSSVHCFSVLLILEYDSNEFAST